METIVNAIILIGRPVFMWFLLLNLIPVMIWLERKGSAYIQDRVGPNRASIMGFRFAGMLHNIADVIKLMTKEDVVPASVSKGYYIAAPFIAMTVALLTYAVIPFADNIHIPGWEPISMQAADLGVGFLYIFAISSLAVYAVVLAGWASNSKYSLLGGLRSSAQMISYEVSLGLSIVGIVLIFGSVHLNDIVRGQGELFLGIIPMWGIIIQPLGFFLYLTCAFAETNRNPFDLPEGESELVAGYHVEYSSMKFALFFMAEYVNILVQAAIITTLFFGGWQVPWMPTDTLNENIGMVVLIVCLVNSFLFAMLCSYLYRFHQSNRNMWSDSRKNEGLWLSGGAAVLSMVFLIGGIASIMWEIDSFGASGAIFTALIQFGVFLTKLLLVAWLFIWVRWTLPRFRYDQLMKLGWQVMLPLALVNLLVTSAVLLFIDSPTTSG